MFTHEIIAYNRGLPVVDAPIRHVVDNQAHQIQYSKGATWLSGSHWLVTTGLLVGTLWALSTGVNVNVWLISRDKRCYTVKGQATYSRP